MFLLIADSALKKSKMNNLKRKNIIILILILLLACNSHKSDSKQGVVFSYNNIIAHRGAWKTNNLPQNSIASLKNAIALKFRGSEFDVRMTVDDSLIVNHDSDYNNLIIEETTYADLADFKLSNGEKLPTLREYILAGIENNYTTQLICEIKPSDLSKERSLLIATKVVQLVEDLKAQNWVIYISFDYDILKKIKELNPFASTQYLEGDKSPEELKKDYIDGADYEFTVFKSHTEWIESAKNNNITLNTWTVNDVSDLDWAIANNFDFITTNEPELLKERNKLRSKLYKGYHLIWSDEFEYSGLPDSTKWSYDVGGHGWENNEQQFYLEKSLENSFVKDGMLHIVALKKEHENSQYTSARLITYQKFSLQYGKIEVMAKLPIGKGTWPAICMLPESLLKKNEKWPLCGEIDIMQHVGKAPNVIHTSLHSELYNFFKNNQYTHFSKLPDVINSFHLYGIEWTSKSIKFFVDNNLFYEAVKGENGKETTNQGWPFDKPYFLILNLAIGGNWGGKIDDSIFPAEMQIAYVRVYQKLN